MDISRINLIENKDDPKWVIHRDHACVQIELHDIIILLFSVILKCHDNQNQGEIFSTVIQQHNITMIIS